MTFALENNWSDQSLDALGLLALLDGEWALDDVLPDIILLGQIEQFADLGGTLGSQALGDGDISKAGDLSFTLLHGETLLVIATGDADNVSLPFVSERVDLDFS